MGDFLGHIPWLEFETTLLSSCLFIYLRHPQRSMDLSFLSAADWAARAEQYPSVCKDKIKSHCKNSAGVDLASRTALLF